MIHGLTERQYHLLTFIKAFEQSHGYMPSYVEMKDALGLASKCSISRLVDALEERGHICRIPNKARSIQLAINPTRAEK